MRDDEFMVGAWLDRGRIVFLLAEALDGCFDQILNLQFRTRCNILVMLEGGSFRPRIVLDVSCANQSSLSFSWQVQSLVKLQYRFSWQGQYLVKLQ